MNKDLMTNEVSIEGQLVDSEFLSEAASLAERVNGLESCRIKTYCTDCDMHQQYWVGDERYMEVTVTLSNSNYTDLFINVANIKEWHDFDRKKDSLWIRSIHLADSDNYSILTHGYTGRKISRKTFLERMEDTVEIARIIGMNIDRAKKSMR